MHEMKDRVKKIWQREMHLEIGKDVDASKLVEERCASAIKRRESRRNDTY